MTNDTEFQSAVIAKLERDWKRAQLVSNEGDWLKSEVAVRAFLHADGEKDRAYQIFTKIGVQDGSKGCLSRMRSARESVPDKDVWLACGWGRVRKLVAMSDKARASAVAAIRSEVSAGTMPRKAAAKVLPVLPEAPKEKGKSKSAEVGASGSTPRVAHTVTEHTRGGGLLEHALSDLAKISAFNPATLDLLSADVREAVEQRMKARKTA